MSSELQDGFREDRRCSSISRWLRTATACRAAWRRRARAAGGDGRRAAVRLWAIDKTAVAAVQPMRVLSHRAVHVHDVDARLAAAMALLGTVGVRRAVVPGHIARREIGALALGAQPARIMRTVVAGRRRRLVGGWRRGAWGLTRLLSDLLYNTPQLDVATFPVTAVVLFWSRCWRPRRRDGRRRSAVGASAERHRAPAICDDGSIYFFRENIPNTRGELSLRPKRRLILSQPQPLSAQMAMPLAPSLAARGTRWSAP